MCTKPLRPPLHLVSATAEPRWGLHSRLCRRLDAGSVSSLSFRVPPWSSLPDAASAAFAGMSSHPTLRIPGLTQFPLLVLTPQSWVLSFLPCLPSFPPHTHSQPLWRKEGSSAGQGGELGPAVGREESARPPVAAPGNAHLTRELYEV